jgi:hypothetical protein
MLFSVMSVAVVASPPHGAVWAVLEFFISLEVSKVADSHS